MGIRIIRIAHVKLTAYIRECREELGKVLWPTRPQLIRNTALVIGVSLALAVFLGVVDYVAKIGFEQFLKLR